jgi:hypothetical protein
VKYLPLPLAFIFFFFLLQTNFGGTEGEDRQVGRWFGCGSATGSSR